MFIGDEYFKIWDNSKVLDCMTDLKQCVREQDINGFNELMPKYNNLILESVLEMNRKIIMGG